MKVRTIGVLLASLSAAALSGCVSYADIVADQEGLLAAAGFVAQPANTPERQASLARLPPGRLIQQLAQSGEQFTYVFADPTLCNCLYFGDAAAYGRYQQELLQRQLVSNQLYAAQLYNEAAFDWGPWGGYGFGGYGFYGGGFYGRGFYDRGFFGGPRFGGGFGGGFGGYHGGGFHGGGEFEGGGGFHGGGGGRH